MSGRSGLRKRLTYGATARSPREGLDHELAAYIWAAVSGVYDLAPLPPAATARLRDRFLHGARQLAAADGTVPCGFAVAVGTAQLR